MSSNRQEATMSNAKALKIGFAGAALLMLGACVSPDEVSSLDTRVGELERRVDAAEARNSQLEAAANPLEPVEGLQVAGRERIPVTALLRIEDARDALRNGQVRASLELYTPADPEQVTIAGRTVPREVEPTASLAFGLSNPEIWATEIRGFLFGDLFQKAPTHLVALQPHQPGRTPVVFVHGTASSAGRWADMLNDLQSDPAIRERFEFWFFSYETGNPIPYSALQLRQALEQPWPGSILRARTRRCATWCWSATARAACWSR